jgi:GTPase SAR1 family protein
MEQFKSYNLEKAKLVTALSAIRLIVGKLDGLGMNVDDDIQKIEKAILDIESDTLRIALVGAYSDGKTSVIAGWLGQVMPNMKIDIDESSDRLAIYHPDNLPEKCEIIDTPGLFGDKERSVDGEKAVVKYGDITKKYLSEAHLIFYVVDVTNPLKDSHKETVRWILRDLNKLSSTIFVINKMDEVADLRDADDFNNQAAIKKDNLRGKLQRFVELSPVELAALNIVCISSNPNDRGLEFWFEKKDIYEERSRMGVLKTMTSTVLDDSTRSTLIRKTGADVIRGLVSGKIETAEHEFLKVSHYIDEVSSSIARIEEDIKRGKVSVIAAKSDLFAELMASEKRLLGGIRTLSAEDVKPFLEDEIGFNGDDIGFKLRLSIDLACERYFQQSATIMHGIAHNIEKQLDASESFISSISKMAFSNSGKLLGKVGSIPVGTIKNGVFFARDVLGSITGVAIKFKPWEAAKIAGNISKWAGPAGVAISLIADAVSLMQQRKAEAALQQCQEDLTSMVKENFMMVYDILKDADETYRVFAPQLAGFMTILENQKQSLSDLMDKKSQLAAIRLQFEKVVLDDVVTDVEYREV